MLAYVETHYHPASLIISVAGNIEHAQVLRQVEAFFGDWRGRQRPSWQESLPPRDTLPIGMIKKKTEQTNICLATLGTAYTSPDYYVILLINALLGDGMSSRLFQSIREEQGLAYDIGSYFNSYYETGSLVISAGVDPSQTEAAIEAIVHELNSLRETAVAADELRRIKAYVRGGILLGLEGTQQVASWLASQESLRNQIMDVDEILARIDAVTSQDIQRVAQFCFAPQWRRLAMIGPDDPDRAQHFAALLRGV
jgi:predicted Zn-dependent peptidase